MHDRAAQKGEAKKLTPALRQALEFLKQTIPGLPEITHQVREEDKRKPLLIWTDAMYDSNKAEGGFVVIEREADSPVGATNKGHIYLAGGPTPKAVKDQFKPGKKQYIGQHEIAWGLAPYSTLPRVCTRREILHWIDNTSALAGLVKGYAKAADMARVSNAAWALLLGLEAQPYFEYVRSKANIGDLARPGGRWKKQ